MKVNISDNRLPLQIQWANTTDLMNTFKSRDDIEGERIFPRSRFHHACCMLGQNLFLFGGKDRCEPLKDFWKLNLVSWKWSCIETNKGILPHLQGHTMVAYKSQIFIFGGTFYEAVVDTPLWIYNSDMNIMKRYLCRDHLPRPVARREHSAVTHEHIMYVFGGFSDSSGSTNELWAFDMEAEEWKEVPNSKPVQRHSHVAVTYSGCMWIHGGMKNLTYLSDLWMFHITLRTWRKIKGYGTSPFLSGHSANVVYDNIVFTGGNHNGKPSSDIWIFNLSRHTWRCIRTPKEILFPPISLHTSVVIDPVKIAQSNADVPATSLPNLKSHTPLLPWHQSPSNIRPWTSPAPGSQKDSRRNPNLVSELTTLLDRNSSEEDIIEYPILVQNRQNSGGEFDNPDSVLDVGEKSCRSKGIDVLKIAPALFEGCCDKSSLLKTLFLYNDSDMDGGIDNPAVDKNEMEEFVSNHSNMAQRVKSTVPCHDRWSIGEDVSFFTNRLYESLYGRESNNELSYSGNGDGKVYTNKSTHSTPQIISEKPQNKKPQSSELVLEDLESCEDDYVLRNIKLELPSNSSLCWSSLINLSSPSYPFTFNHGRGTNFGVSRQNFTKSLNNLQSDIDGSLNSLLVKQNNSKALNSVQSKIYEKIEHLKDYAYENQIKKRSRYRNINVVKKQSRNSQRNSRAYTKHSVARATTESESVTHSSHLQEINLSSRHNQFDCQHISSFQPPLTSDLRPTQSISDTRELILPNAKNENIQHDESERNLTRNIPRATIRDKRLILLILGGETEIQDFNPESLKTWNCYLF